MNKLLTRLSANLPFREISDGTVPYLERYFLGETEHHYIYLHRFVGSDPARGLHNHKWFAWSFILSGWYWEERAWGRRKVRWFNRIDPDTLHRVVLPAATVETEYYEQGHRKIERVVGLERQPCWTLFLHSKKNAVPSWGFRKEVEGELAGTWKLIPHDYSKEGDQTNWWLTAKSRKEVKGY